MAFRILYTLLAHKSFLTPNLKATSKAIWPHENDLVEEFFVIISLTKATILRAIARRLGLGLSITYKSKSSLKIFRL